MTVVERVVGEITILDVEGRVPIESPDRPVRVTVRGLLRQGRKQFVLNLAGVRRPASRTKARQLLEKLGLGARMDFAPDSLSAGEKQRVALARALANGPAIILADEPTGSLDSRAGQQVIELLRNAALEAAHAVLIVSHDLRIQRYADRVFRMEDGRLADGPFTGAWDGPGQAARA